MVELKILGYASTYVLWCWHNCGRRNLYRDWRGSWTGRNRYLVELYFCGSCSQYFCNVLCRIIIYLPQCRRRIYICKESISKIDIPSFLTGWTVAFHSSATIAAVLLAFSGYFNTFLKYRDY